MKLRLLRYAHLPNATFGYLRADVLVADTLELPYNHNRQDVSCIPLGTYPLIPFNSPTKGRVYQLVGVPDRDAIEIHIGNSPMDTHGCILVGRSPSYTFGNEYVVDSAPTMERLRNLLGSTDRHSLSVEMYNPYSE